jgi:hypothetical protein
MKIMDGALEMLLSLQPPRLCAAMRLEFVGEVAVDAGGVQREW